ncbi:hypothetical protein BH23GEM5_BH23GEM5_19210 [soil metagenome]|jgi:hypothetical protein
MRTHWLLAALAGLALFAPEIASAQAPNLAGSWVRHAEGSDDINAKINEATARMNFALRGIGRSRLRKTNTPYQRLAIAYNAQQVTITTDGRSAIQTPANGTPIRWKREDGEMLNVSTDWKNTVLEQTFAAEDGKRVNRYTLSGDGRMMTLEVTITSPRLPQPLVYRQMYHRA